MNSFADRIWRGLGGRVRASRLWILRTLAAQGAIAKGPFLLGDRFSMADVVFGGTLRFMVTFKQIEPTPAFSAYIERLDQRPAFQRAEARNQSMRKELGLQ